LTPPRHRPSSAASAGMRTEAIRARWRRSQCLSLRPPFFSLFFFSHNKYFFPLLKKTIARGLFLTLIFVKFLLSVFPFLLFDLFSTFPSLEWFLETFSPSVIHSSLSPSCCASAFAFFLLRNFFLLGRDGRPTSHFLRFATKCRPFCLSFFAPAPPCIPSAPLWKSLISEFEVPIFFSQVLRFLVSLSVPRSVSMFFPPPLWPLSSTRNVLRCALPWSV